MYCYGKDRIYFTKDATGIYYLDLTTNVVMVTASSYGGSNYR
jgi:hypothetical protein